MAEANLVADGLHEYEKDWFAQRGIEDPAVMAAVNAVSRREFVLVGEDEGGEALPAVSLPPVEVAAKLLEALQIGKDSKVLEIGTDTGYLTALLAEIAGSVYTVERRLPLAKLAEGRFEKLGVKGVEILYGPRLTEYALNAPYDGILLSAVAPRIPEKLTTRLAIGGRMVVPIGDGQKHPEIICIRREGEDQFVQESLGQLRFSSKLGEILLEMGVADREDIELAAMEADASGTRLGEALLQHAQIQERDLVRALAIQRGFKVLPVDRLLKIADHELVYSVPKAFLENHRLLPLVAQNGQLSLVTVDPDAPGIELARLLDCSSVETYLVTAEEFDRIWNTLLEGRRPAPGQEDNLKSRVEGKLEKILRAAVRVNATMVHIDNGPEGGKLRFRIEGGLRDIPEMSVETAELAYLVEFLKRAARLDVLEQRIPQRGRVSWVREPVTYHINVQVMPSIMGEELTIQLLSQGSEVPTLKGVGFSEEMIGELEGLLGLGRGLFLIVGPRHMNKTQTLYAVMKMLGADRSKKVALLEEDILAPIPNVQQALVHPEAGFGYREALGEFARSDVDVLGLGDIPDPATALEALSVTRRGMMMVGVLHGKNSIHVLKGLRDFGIPAEALVNGVTGLLTQRLAPKICDSCKMAHKPEPGEIKKLFPNGAPLGFAAYRGEGCRECGFTGIKGRVPLLELLVMNDQIRRALLGDVTERELRQITLQSGMESLSEYAVRMVRDGQIPIDELHNYIPVS